jgi:hypothetical protein
MGKLLRTLGIASLAIAMVAAASIALPPVLLRDAPAPARIAPHVADARASVWGAAFRFPLPLHLRFVGARCRADGGEVLVFEQWEPPYLMVRYGYAMTGRWPPLGWSGGSNWDDLADDPEIAQFLGSEEVPCE